MKNLEYVIISPFDIVFDSFSNFQYISVLQKRAFISLLPYKLRC